AAVAPCVYGTWWALRPSTSITSDTTNLDHAGGAQALARGGVVAELDEDLVVVLAEQRCCAIDGAGRLRQVDGHAERLDGAGARVHEIHDHAARERVGVVERLGVGVDRTARDAGGRELLQPVRAGFLRGRLLDLGGERVPVLQALGAAGEARIVEQIRAAERATESVEELVVGGADGEPAVAGAQR